MRFLHGCRIDRRSQNATSDRLFQLVLAERRRLWTPAMVRFVDEHQAALYQNPSVSSSRQKLGPKPLLTVSATISRDPSELHSKHVISFPGDGDTAKISPKDHLLQLGPSYNHFLLLTLVNLIPNRYVSIRPSNGQNLFRGVPSDKRDTMGRLSQWCIPCLLTLQSHLSSHSRRGLKFLTSSKNMFTSPPAASLYDETASKENLGCQSICSCL